MKLDFARESEKSTREQPDDAFELTDEELAGVVGGDCCGNGYGGGYGYGDGYGHRRRFRYYRRMRCWGWDWRGRCRGWGYW